MQVLYCTASRLPNCFICLYTSVKGAHCFVCHTLCRQILCNTQTDICNAQACSHTTKLTSEKLWWQRSANFKFTYNSSTVLPNNDQGTLPKVPKLFLCNATAVDFRSDLTRQGTSHYMTKRYRSICDHVCPNKYIFFLLKYCVSLHDNLAILRYSMDSAYQVGEISACIVDGRIAFSLQQVEKLTSIFLLLFLRVWNLVKSKGEVLYFTLRVSTAKFRKYSVGGKLMKYEHRELLE